MREGLGVTARLVHKAVKTCHLLLLEKHQAVCFTPPAAVSLVSKRLEIISFDLYQLPNLAQLVGADFSRARFFMQKASSLWGPFSCSWV